jgi:taurine dioxygenase
MTQTISIKPLTGCIGAEVEGVNIADRLVGKQVDQLRQALNEHQVLFFRGQPLTPRQQCDFAARFGNITESLVDPGNSPAPGITVIETSDPKGIADVWHTDHTFVETPPMAAMLHSVRIPRIGGDTLWANMQAAYDDLTPAMKAFLDPLTAVHSTDRMIAAVSAKKNAEFKMTRHAVSHPVVRIHPETGRKSVFVSSYYTTRINELAEAESDAILRFLFEHIKSPQYQVRFKWEEATSVLWDERSTIHFAVADYDEPRVMHRLMIDGDKPFGPQFAAPAV